MNQVLALQLAVSFLAGGLLIALFTIVAERVPARMAGIILNLPSTLLISFLFIGWTLGPDRVVEIAPGLPLTFGVTLLFNLVYVVIALRVRGNVRSMAVATFMALLFWFAFSAPLAYLQFRQPALSVAGFAAAALFAYVAFGKVARNSPSVRIHFTTSEIVFRSCFAGLIIAVVVLLSKTLGVFWGGMFSAFPAANLSSLLILQRSRGAHALSGIVRNMPVGAVSPIIYLFGCAAAFPALGTVGGTIVALSMSLVYAVFAATILLRPASHEHAVSSSPAHP